MTAKKTGTKAATKRAAPNKTAAQKQVEEAQASVQAETKSPEPVQRQEPEVAPTQPAEEAFEDSFDGDLEIGDHVKHNGVILGGNETQADYRPEHVAKPMSHTQDSLAAQTHESFEFPDTYEAAETFPKIPPRAGMENRWIAVDSAGTTLYDNISKKMRHWQPVSVRTVDPMLARPSMANHGQFGEVIYVRGMILCESTIRLQNSRREHIRKKTRLQTKGSAKSHLDEAAGHIGGQGAGTYGKPFVEQDRETTTSRIAPRGAEEDAVSDVAPD